MDSSHHIETHVDTHFNHMHHELFTEEDKKLFWFGIRSNAIKIEWGKLSSHLFSDGFGSPILGFWVSQFKIFS